MFTILHTVTLILTTPCFVCLYSVFILLLHTVIWWLAVHVTGNCLALLAWQRMEGLRNFTSDQIYRCWVQRTNLLDQFSLHRPVLWPGTFWSCETGFRPDDLSDLRFTLKPPDGVNVVIQCIFPTYCLYSAVLIARNGIFSQKAKRKNIWTPLIL